MSNINSYRRKFLSGIVGTAAAVSIAPGLVLREVQAKPADEAVTDKKTLGHVDRY